MHPLFGILYFIFIFFIDCGKVGPYYFRYLGFVLLLIVFSYYRFWDRKFDDGSFGTGIKRILKGSEIMKWHLCLFLDGFLYLLCVLLFIMDVSEYRF